MRGWARGLAGLIGVLVVATGAFAAYAWKPAFDPVATPAPASFDPALVARGEKLAAAGYCLTCHTPAGGKPYAGGLPMVTAFGTIYSTNITPDPATGIGAWSPEAFRRAMHEGVRRDGAHLLPAFPYDHFTKVSDADIEAIYAFLMTRPAVVQAPPPNTVPFPLNVRLLQAGWKLLFFKDGRYQPAADQSDTWNRGAYLAEGLSHCAACHTPRNALGAEKTGADARYAGAHVDGWYAPPLTAANPAPVAWSADELDAYLRQGGTAWHGVAAGPMSNVVHQGLARIDAADVRAIATYFAAGNGSADRPAVAAQVVSDVLAKSRFAAPVPGDRGANLFAAACSACHYNPAAGVQLQRPELGLKSSLSAPDPTDLVQVIVHGISVKDGLPGAMMPAFGTAFSDDDIATLAAWLRATRTSLPPWTDVPAVVAKVRRGDAS